MNPSFIAVICLVALKSDQLESKFLGTPGKVGDSQDRFPNHSVRSQGDPNFPTFSGTF